MTGDLSIERPGTLTHSSERTPRHKHPTVERCGMHAPAGFCRAGPRGPATQRLYDDVAAAVQHPDS
jgi:hypothetical protein